MSMPRARSLITGGDDSRMAFAGRRESNAQTQSRAPLKMPRKTIMDGSRWLLVCAYPSRRPAG